MDAAELEQGNAPQGQGNACLRTRPKVMAWLSLTPETTSKLSGVSVPFGLHLFPWKMRVAGPVLQGKGWPPCLLAPGLQWGRMRLQRIAMVTGAFLIILVVSNCCSGPCTTKQPSKRRWDFRPLLMSVFPWAGKTVCSPGGRRGPLLLA